MSLKDESAQVRAAMFRNRNQLCRFQPENGQRIRLRARVSLYEGRGEFQLIVEHMELAGDGGLQAAFEQLKLKLAAEGLFDPTNKLAMPAYPRRVALVTSGTGAVLHDLISVFSRRYPVTQLILVNSRVQGEGADAELVAAIQRIERAHAVGCAVDAIVMARGGGSAEDLWSFNSEALARTIYACDIPIISAVGHETDFTICDLVADERAPTPSAAAELLTRDIKDILNVLRQGEARIFREVLSALNRSRQSLDWLERRIKDPRQRLTEQSAHLHALQRRLRLAQERQLGRAGHGLSIIAGALREFSPTPRLRVAGQKLEHLSHRLASGQRNRLGNVKHRLSQATTLLDAVSPLATVARGYSILVTADGSVVSDTSQVEVGATVRAQLAEGGLSCTVTDVDSNSLPTLSRSPESLEP